MADIALFVGIALDGNRIDLSQPAPQINLPAALAAKRHRLACRLVKRSFANWAAEHIRLSSAWSDNEERNTNGYDLGFFGFDSDLAAPLDFVSDFPVSDLPLSDFAVSLLLELSLDEDDSDFGFSASAAFL
jgi:hypothetical protein